MVRASVVILNWNSMRWLDDCLSSVLRDNALKICQVILADNGSTDGSIEHVRKTFPEVTLVEFGRNYGFAEGNNQAVKFTQGEDYLIFVNTDTKAQSGWLTNLIKAADEHPEYQILCSIQIPSQEKNRARVLNAYGIPMSSPYESTLRITDSIFASGAAFLIRRKWLNHIGFLFDAYYSAYAEDLELSLRSVLLGGRIGYVSESRIYHYIGGAGMPLSKASFLATRNILLTYYKLFELENFVRIFIAQFVYIIGRIFARKEQLPITMGMAKGFAEFFSSFPRYLSFRREFLHRKKRDDAFVFSNFLYRNRIESVLFRRGLYGC